MENTSYGINVANRYDLFCIDDDAGDPMEAILKNKQKQQKKQQAASAAAAATGAPAPGAAAAAAGAGPQPQQPSAQAKSNVKGGGEKENKSAGGRGAENRHPDKAAAQTNGTGNLHNQRGTERRGIKETQKDNIRNQENQKTGGGVGGAGGNQGNAKLPRGTGPNHKNGILAPGGGGGNDDKFRKTRDFDDGQRKPYPQNGGAAGGGPKRFDGRGKRELDRQSGSNKTGIKSVDKRDGAGSHNWGSSKQDAKEFSNLQDQEYQPQDADTSADEKTNPERTNAANGGEGGEAADGAANAKSEDEAKEMTLDEWKAQKAAVRLKPQYNLRKAGEGEDSAQWDKMVALDRKPVKAGEAEAEDDENNDTQKAAAGGKGGKQVLDIEFHFNDNRRGGLGRTRGGRGGKGGGRGMGRDGPGGRRGDFGGENYRSSGAGGEHGYNQDGGAGGGGAAEGGMERPQRDNVRRNNRPPFAGGGGGPDRSYDGGMNKYSRPNPRASKQQHAPAAPKVDDEHDFPSLG